MTDEQWAKLAPLVKAKDEAWERFKNLGIEDTATDPRERMEQSQRYERARMEAYEAAVNLTNAERTMGLLPGEREGIRPPRNFNAG